MVIPDGYAQINWVMGGGGLPLGAECTLGLDVSDWGGDIAGVAAICAEAWVDNILIIQSEQISLESVHVKYGPNDTGPTYDLAVNEDGSASEDGVPANTSLLVRKNTALGGRAGRGRMYIPAINEDIVGTSGLIPSGDVTVFQNDLDAFYGALASEDLLPVVLHGPDSPLSVPTLITDFGVQNKVATQRRRLRR